MIRTILISLISFLTVTTIIIISNIFSGKKIAIDKRYVVKASFLFLLSAAILFFLEKL